MLHICKNMPNKSWLLLFSIMLLPFILEAAPTTNNTTILVSSAPIRLNQAILLSSANSEQQLQLLVWLKGQNQDQLDQFLHNLYTPGNPQYHKFLTPTEFTTTYGPPQANIATVKEYLLQQGFTVNSIPSNGAFIQVSAPIATIEQTFRVNINNYGYNGKIRYSNDQAVSLDPTIASMITHVSGLNNFTEISHGPVNNHIQSNKLQAGSITTGAYTPQLLQKAYGVDKLLNQGINGNGQTVAIIYFYDDPTVENDLNVFSARYGLPLCTTASSCFTKLNQYGQPFPLPENAPSSDTIEMSIDTQSIHSFAPNAKIILVETNSANFSDLDIAINTIVSNNLAKIISNSWGSTPEDPNDPLEIILKQGAVQGISINFSSGDDADYRSATSSTTPLVEYPAASSWVTAVGGSSLLMTSDGHYKNETGWASPWQDSGSSGGLSQYYTAQSWQTNAIGNVYAGGYGIVGTHRAIPDISLLGDPYTGIVIYDSANGRYWGSGLGGTSVACPEFSGMLALANQARSQRNLPSIGLVTSLLYSMPYNQHQGIAPITNIVGPHATAFSVLTAPPGWNDITGLGSPYAPLFVQALVNSN